MTSPSTWAPLETGVVVADVAVSFPELLLSVTVLKLLKTLELVQLVEPGELVVLVELLELVVLVELAELVELLKLLVVLLNFLSLQDLQHICRYPLMAQYRLNTSIRQNTERSPRQRCLEELCAAGKLGLDLDSHRMMAFFWSPVQGGAWHARVVIG